MKFTMVTLGFKKCVEFKSMIIKKLICACFFGFHALAFGSSPFDSVDSNKVYREQESEVFEIDFSKYHSSISFFGISYGNKFCEVYSSMHLIETFALNKKDKSDDFPGGILSPSLSGVALIAVAINLLEKGNSGLTPVQKGFFLSPYILNPEIRFFPSANMKPYIGYAFNLVYDGRVAPILSAGGGVILDYFKSQVRIRIGYDTYEYKHENFGFIKVGLAFGISGE